MQLHSECDMVSSVELLIMNKHWQMFRAGEAWPGIYPVQKKGVIYRAYKDGRNN